MGEGTGGGGGGFLGQGRMTAAREEIVLTKWEIVEVKDI